MSMERRLTALEHQHQQRQGPGRLGIRIFQQSKDTPEVFYELPGAFYAGPQGYTRADLDQLSAMGWQLITVVHRDDHRVQEAA